MKLGHETELGNSVNKRYERTLSPRVRHGKPARQPPLLRTIRNDLSPVDASLLRNDDIEKQIFVMADMARHGAWQALVPAYSMVARGWVPHQSVAR